MEKMRKEESNKKERELSNKEVRLMNQDKEDDDADDDIEVVDELSGAEARAAATAAAIPLEVVDEDVENIPRDKDGFLAPKQGARKKILPPPKDKN